MTGQLGVRPELTKTLGVPIAEAVVLAAIVPVQHQWDHPGRVRRRSLKRLAAMDDDAKAKEILFLKDRVYQLGMQLSILQRQLNKRSKNSRYTVREKLLSQRV